MDDHDKVTAAAIALIYCRGKDERSKKIVQIAHAVRTQGSRAVLDALNALSLLRSEIDGPMDEKALELAEERLLEAWEAGLS